MEQRLRHIEAGAGTASGQKPDRSLRLASARFRPDDAGTMSEVPSLTGRLLVAMPGIGDPRFEHAVILICAHGPDHAMGLRLDRPAPGVDLKTVLDKLDAPAPDQSIGRAVLMGGPVERERFLAIELREGALDGASGVLVASGAVVPAVFEEAEVAQAA